MATVESQVGIGFLRRLIPFPLNWEDYLERVRRGYEYMKQHTVVVGAIARDVAVHVPGFAQRLSCLVGCFKSYHVIVYENDSVDDTPRVLKLMADRFANMEVISEVLGTRKFSSVGPGNRSVERTTNLAAARNKVLDEVRLRYSDFDYFCVVDLDVVDWDQDGVATSFAYEDWDMMGSQSLIQLGCQVKHYDTWAFREWGDFEAMDYRLVADRIFRLGSRPIRVSSCFGGLGFYRMSSVMPFRYTGNDCEHVELHRAMAAGGKDHIFLNPSSLVLHRR